MSLLTAEWPIKPTHAASFFISSSITLFLQRATAPEMPRLHKTAELTRWQLHLTASIPRPCLTRVHNVSTFIQCTASRILLDAKVNNDTSYFIKVLPKRNPKEPKNQKNKDQKNRKMSRKKSPRVGLNPSYRIPTKWRRAIPSYHSDIAVLL